MKEIITFDVFEKIDIRKGQVLSVEAVPKKDKLLKLQVDLGEELGTRTILAGIALAEKYGKVVDGVWQDSCLVGQTILVVVNLAPRKMAGIESHGMLLAAHGVDDNDIWLATVGPVPNGRDIG